MMKQFTDPWFLLLAVVILPLIWLFIIRRRRAYPAVTFTMLEAVRKSGRSSYKRWLRYLPLLALLASIVLMAVALARPQDLHEGEDINTEGIDIVLALDISASMLAQDFSPDRVSAAKAVATEFIGARPDDRIAIVLFAKQAFTQCPLTIDHSILIELLSGVEVGLADPEATAIGQALAAALNRLKASESMSKVVILLTDGENNFGLPPTTAAEAAEALGVRVYTIGIGTRGQALYPGRDMFGRPASRYVQVSIDEDLLKDIAKSTGGQYFRATNNDKLKAIFAEIDQMEKTKIEIRAFKRYSERFYPWAAASLVALLIGLIVTITLLRGIT